jgi:predicted transcriptional regulator
MGVVESKYVQAILDLVYSKGVVKLEFLANEVGREFGLDKAKARRIVWLVLDRLAKKGLVAKKGRGYYAKP